MAQRVDGFHLEVKFFNLMWLIRRVVIAWLATALDAPSEQPTTVESSPPITRAYDRLVHTPIRDNRFSPFRTVCADYG